MAAAASNDQYKATIGIETHVQLNTRTKLFAAVGNDARNAKPNTLVSHICFGMPGALPVLNEAVIEKAMIVAFAFNTKPQKYSYFERKHYFYPDLPKGYQITQLEQPIIAGGSVNISAGGHEKTVRLNRVQIEEDAGKTLHPTGKDYSLVDLNRAGTPLLEIVSEPDMNSAEEAKAYARELWLLMRFTDVSDADMYFGNMRFDINVSVSNNPSKRGLRTETKNLNSFRAVEKAATYEIKRQIELLKKGKKVVQETRGWDDAKQKTFSQRSKEDAHDYRYFPDPDLPPIELTDDMIGETEKNMVTLPAEWRTTLQGAGISKGQIEILLENEAMNDSFSYLSLIQQELGDKEKVKFLTNWVINNVAPIINEGRTSIDQQRHDRIMLSLYELIKADKLSSTNAKALFEELVSVGKLPENIESYAEEKGYIQVSDAGEIESIVTQIIEQNPKAAQDVKDGEMKAIGYLVGQAMKASRGKANPALVKDLLLKKLR